LSSSLIEAPLAHRLSLPRPFLPSCRKEEPDSDHKIRSDDEEDGRDFRTPEERSIELKAVARRRLASRPRLSLQRKETEIRRSPYTSYVIRPKSYLRVHTRETLPLFLLPLTRRRIRQSSSSSFSRPEHRLKQVHHLLLVRREIRRSWEGWFGRCCRTIGGRLRLRGIGDTSTKRTGVRLAEGRGEV